MDGAANFISLAKSRFYFVSDLIYDWWLYDVYNKKFNEVSLGKRFICVKNMQISFLAINPQKLYNYAMPSRYKVCIEKFLAV